MQIEEMIKRGITPPPVEMRAWMVKQGCPETLIRSVADKNARLVETRSRVRSTRHEPAFTEAQIDEMVLALKARDHRVRMLQTIL